jgi:hypothetical protein
MKKKKKKTLRAITARTSELNNGFQSAHGYGVVRV